MESRILSAVGKIAGLGGIALGVLLLVFQGVLKTHFLPDAGLNSAQAFATIFSLVILTFGIAGIGVIAWLISRTVGPSVPIPTLALGALTALMTLLLGAAVFVGAKAIPNPAPVVGTTNHPMTAQTIPPPPTPPSRPADGIWDVVMSCGDTSAVREMGAEFKQGRYARGFKSGSVSGMTELAMGYSSDDTIKVTGYIVFDDSDVYLVDALARRTTDKNFAGFGRLGSSSHCQVSITDKAA